MRFSVRAPASSANLGPGFDALGLALDLWNVAEIVDGVTDTVALAGTGADLLDGRENLTRPRCGCWRRVGGARSRRSR